MKKKFSDFALSQKDDYFLIDVKTDGLRSNKDRIVEIDFIVIKKGVVRKEWYRCLNPKKEIQKSQLIQLFLPLRR